MEENIGGDDSDKIDCGYNSRPMPSASRPLEKPAHPTSRPSSTSYQQSFPSDFSSVIFSRALDVACAAQKAQDHVVEAAKKAAYISELADMAYQEVDALHDVAADLATMAKSVAQTTMDICHFDSLEEAYKSSTAHKEKIDFESFVNVLHPEFSPHEVFLQRRPSNRLPRERLPLPSNSESRDGQRVVKPAPNSGASTGSSGHRRWSLPDRQCGSGPLRLFDQDVTQTQEKFPSRPSVEERKESMAAVFDNTHPITPLWEDRYCNVAREDEAVSTNTPSDNAGQWQKKKAMKQFQIRLQHNQGLDSDNSAECLSSDRFESINNTNSKSIQQVRQKKNQLNPRNQQMYPDQSQKTPPAAENVHHSESESSLVSIGIIMTYNTVIDHI